MGDRYHRHIALTCRDGHSLFFYFRANFQSFFSVRQEAFLRVFFYVIFLPLCSLFIRSVIRYTVLGEDIIVKPLFFSPRHSDYQHFCSLLRRTYTLWSAWFPRYSNSTKIGIFLLQLFLANNCFLIPKCMWEGIVYPNCRNRSKRWDRGRGYYLVLMILNYVQYEANTRLLKASRLAQSCCIEQACRSYIFKW